MIDNGCSGLVSIVVPSYNHVEFLVQRIESLLRQTYQNVEIIIVDDCSTNNNVEVLQKYLYHPKVKLVCRESNGGWVTTNTQGLELSLGEYILFAQCDDDCDPQMVESLLKAISCDDRIGLAFCRSYLVDKDNIVLGDDYSGREASFKKKCFQDTVINKSDFMDFLCHSCVIPNLSAVLMRVGCLKNVGGFDKSYKVCGDWDLFFRFSRQYNVAYVAEPLNYFRQHRGTIRSSTHSKIIYDEYFRLLLEQLNFYSNIKRNRLRFRVMYLWCRYLFFCPKIALANFKYNFMYFFKRDSISLLFFVPALIFFIFTGFFRFSVKFFPSLHNLAGDWR